MQVIKEKNTNTSERLRFNNGCSISLSYSNKEKHAMITYHIDAIITRVQFIYESVNDFIHDISNSYSSSILTQVNTNIPRRTGYRKEELTQAMLLTDIIIPKDIDAIVTELKNRFKQTGYDEVLNHFIWSFSIRNRLTYVLRGCYDTDVYIMPANTKVYMIENNQFTVMNKNEFIDWMLKTLERNELIDSDVSSNKA
jgi:hypothetical protein